MWAEGNRRHELVCHAPSSFSHYVQIDREFLLKLFPAVHLSTSTYCTLLCLTGKYMIFKKKSLVPTYTPRQREKKGSKANCLRKQRKARLETFLQTQSLGCQPLGHHTFNWKRTTAILRKTLQINVKKFLTRGDELKFCMDSKPIANEISKNTGFKRDGPLNTFFK